MKSSSVTPNNNFPKSSSLTSFHAFSSSDYLKSPSSDRAVMSTFDRCVKSNSTTSYDVKSTTPSRNSDETLSPVESKPCEVVVPLPAEQKTVPVDQLVMNMTAKKEQEKLPRAEFVAHDPTDSSQYNSSEELAMIFGIRQTSVTPPTGNQVISFSEWSELESAVDGDEDEDDIELDRNNNSLSAINNNNSFDDQTDLLSNSNPKSAAPKLHGLRYFGTKRNELEIIFENPHENGCVYEDPETEDLSEVKGRQRVDSDEDEVDDLDLKFTTEIVISKDMSVTLDRPSEVISGDKQVYHNELDINVIGGGLDVVDAIKESETEEAFRNDAAVVGELDCGEQGLAEKNVDVDDEVDGIKGALEETAACETSLADERGSGDLESSPSSSSNKKSEAAIANKVSLPLTCNEPRGPVESSERSTGMLGEGGSSSGSPVRRRNHANQNDLANGKERPNLLHPEHFLFASLAYQGLSSYDDILTMLAILIALITLIALVFI